MWQDKELCLERCDFIRDGRPKASEDLMTKLKEQYLPKNPFQIDYPLDYPMDNNKKLDLSVRSTNKQIDLLNIVGGTLEPVMGTDMTWQVTSLLSDKIPLDKIVKLVPRIVHNYQLARHSKRISTKHADYCTFDLFSFRI